MCYSGIYPCKNASPCLIVHFSKIWPQDFAKIRVKARAYIRCWIMSASTLYQQLSVLFHCDVRAYGGFACGWLWCSVTHITSTFFNLNITVHFKLQPQMGTMYNISYNIWSQTSLSISGADRTILTKCGGLDTLAQWMWGLWVATPPIFSKLCDIAPQMHSSSVSN